jgi:predicted ATPase
VRESIHRRLARLSGETNFMLSVASVIGNEFDSRLVERVSESSAEQIVERLDEAARAGIVAGDEAGYGRHRFAHALFRGVLYEDLSASSRIETHGWIATAIEELHKDDLKPHLPALAHHFKEGGIADKAIDYSIESGEAARKTFAYEDAALHWQSALGLMKDHDYAAERKAMLLSDLATFNTQLTSATRKGSGSCNRR